MFIQQGFIDVAGNSAAATNFLARTAGLDGTHTTIYTNLLNGLTTDGFFDGSGNSTLLDALYILATQNTTTAALNLVKNSFNLTTTGANLTFTTDQGYVSTGDALVTGFIPSTAGGSMTQNSAHIFGYDLTNANPGGGTFVGSANGAYTNVIQFDPFVGGVNVEAALNDGKNSYAVTGTGRGSWVANRSGATTGFIRKNAASFDTITATSSGLPNVSMYIVASNQGGAIIDHCTDQIAAVSFGGSLTTTQADALSNRVNTYMAGLSTPINIY